MIWGTWFALKEFRSRKTRPTELPPVSVLKPVKGVEEGFTESLEVFFALDYPVYELIFSVAEAGDPAVPVIKRLQEKYPRCQSLLVIGSEEIGPNPKVNNLIRPYRLARYDMLLISDSNVRVGSDYLRRVVSHHKPGVGVVTAVVAGRDPQGLGGRLEATYLNSFYARWMQISRAAGHSFVVGKQMLFRRSDMDRFGGLTNLGRYIAEDYMAGQAMRRLGLKVVIADEPIQQFIGKYRLEDFWKRHLRWGRIRKAQAPLAFLIEPLFFSLLSGVIGALAFQTWLGVPWYAFIGGHLLIWLFFDLKLMQQLESRLTFEMVASWLLRELLALPLWLHMAVGNSVDWRGKRLRIRTGGLVEVA